MNTERRCGLCGQPRTMTVRGQPRWDRDQDGAAAAPLCEECVLALRRECAGASPAFQRIGDGTERNIVLVRAEE